MYNDSQVKAAELAPHVLKAVKEDEENAYAYSITKRLEAAGTKTNGVLVKSALNFLAEEGFLSTLPPTKGKKKGARERHMFALTLKGHFQLSVMS